VAIIGFGTVDRADRKPNDKNYDNDNVPYCPDFVDPSNEPGGLHGNHSIEDEQEQQHEVGMPRFRLVIRILDHATRDQH
jgi:hypothetical protein